MIKDSMYTVILSSSIAIFSFVLIVSFTTIGILMIARKICCTAIARKILPPFTSMCSD